jgi:hypothetical protein
MVKQISRIIAVQIGIAAAIGIGIGIAICMAIASGPPATVLEKTGYNSPFIEEYTANGLTCLVWWQEAQAMNPSFDPSGYGKILACERID